MKIRSLLACLALTALGACSTQKVSIQSDVLNAKAAKLKVIHVAADPLAANPESAKRLSELIGQEAISTGYSLSKNADKTELILLPTFSRIQSGSDRLSPPPVTHVGIANSYQGLMARESDFDRPRLSSPQKPEFHFALIISAFEQSAWTGAAPGADIPKVWTVTAIMREDAKDQSREAVAKLVKAAAPWFGRSSNGTIDIPVK